MRCTNGTAGGARNRRPCPRRADPAGRRRGAAASRPVRLEDLSAIAVANTPGLAGSLLVGLVAAKTLCVALRKPLVAVNHLHAHIYACRMASGVNVFPCVAVSSSAADTRVCIAVRVRVRSPGWAGRSTTRPARRSTRSLRCWGCRIRVVRRSPARRKRQSRVPTRFRDRFSRTNRVWISASADSRRPSATPSRAWAAATFTTLDLPAAASGRPGRQFSAGRGRLPGRQGAARSAAYRRCSGCASAAESPPIALFREQLSAAMQHSGCGTAHRAAGTVHRQCGHGCDCRRATEGARHRIAGPGYLPWPGSPGIVGPYVRPGVGSGQARRLPRKSTRASTSMQERGGAIT